MATYRQLVYMCIDELKLVSDDSLYTEEHFIFMLDKYRIFLLKQKYQDIKKEMPESNYQTICLNLEETMTFDGEPCSAGAYLRSIEEVPDISTVGKQKVSSMDFFRGNITYINNERFKYVGNNPRLATQVYSTIAPDSHLYIKSANPQAYYLEQVKLTGVFEDSEKAAELECDSDDKCDVMDKEFPIEGSLIPLLIELVVKELGGIVYRPKDFINNASDDMSKQKGEKS